jgi:catechol 2,3-dioxygenase-like lactoylglutathione lyase family enzyme
MVDGNQNGAPPKAGFAALKPEILVTDFQKSLYHWCEIFGFQIAYQRPDEKFAYLEREEGAQVMLSQRHDDQKWETGSMSPPFGRGVMFQIDVKSIDPIIKAMEDQKLTHYDIPHLDGDGNHFSNPREIWRDLGDRQGGGREYFALDPDGYLIMFSQSLGYRPLNP